jgi:hypothetical protein
VAAGARFEGRLKDAGGAGGCGQGVSVLALDGFATEISAADVEAYDWIVAVKRDGRYPGIGQRGPTWIVYARRDGGDRRRGRAAWPGGVLIEVK